MDADLPWSGTVAVADGQVTAIAGTIDRRARSSRYPRPAGRGPTDRSGIEQHAGLPVHLDYEDSRQPASFYYRLREFEQFGRMRGYERTFPSSNRWRGRYCGAARRDGLIDLGH